MECGVVWKTGEPSLSTHRLCPSLATADDGTAASGGKLFWMQGPELESRGPRGQRDGTCRESLEVLKQPTNQQTRVLQTRIRIRVSRNQGLPHAFPPVERYDCLRHGTMLR